MTIQQVETPLADRLKGKLTSAVRRYAGNMPRSRQSAIGASEIGSPCDRQLALKSLGYEQVNSGDPWAAFMGTAVHFKLEQVFNTENAIARDADNQFRLPGAFTEPWRVETRVQIAPGIKGTADLYDVEECTVIDHKVPGDATMDKARRDRVSETYRVQAHCYGYGFEQAGYDVKHVAIAYWPRGKGSILNNVHVWTEPYDAAVARDAIARYLTIVNAAIELDVEQYPDRVSLFATADAPCTWCPFFKYKQPTGGGKCGGHKR